MQVKKMKERDAKFDDVLKELDKKLLTDNVNTIADVCHTKKVLNALPVARATGFFNKLRMIWKD